MNNFKQKSPYASKETTLAEKFGGAHRKITYQLVFEEKTASLTDKSKLQKKKHNPTVQPTAKAPIQAS